MEKQREEIKDYIANFITDLEGVRLDELHQEMFNNDYYLIGRHLAEQFLAPNTFECIEFVKNYEQDNFGEVSTDLSEPEHVCNMVAYIIGEELLNEELQHHYNILNASSTEKLDSLTAKLIAASMEE